MASQDQRGPDSSEEGGPAKAEGTREASCGKENLSGALKNLRWYWM